MECEAKSKALYILFHKLDHVSVTALDMYGHAQHSKQGWL